MNLTDNYVLDEVHPIMAGYQVYNIIDIVNNSIKSSTFFWLLIPLTCS